MQTNISIEKSQALEDNAFPRLRDLARRIGKTVSVFDLETTTFMGVPTFGITEFCIIRIPQDGTITILSSLVNPENPISPEATAINGITNDMVAPFDPFSAWIDAFEETAKNDLVLGFNSASFDMPAVQKQAKRYGRIVEFSDGLDLRNRYVNLMLSYGNGRKGKLEEVVHIFGIEKPAQYHRATADTVATALVGEAILSHYGYTGLLGKAIHALPKPSDKPQAVVAKPDGAVEKIKTHIRIFGYDKMLIATAIGATVNQVADHAWELYNAGHVRIEDICEPAIQHWLSEQLPGCLKTAWSKPEYYGRYKPVMLALCALPNAPTIDYTQLKIGLLRGGHR